MPVFQRWLLLLFCVKFFFFFKGICCCSFVSVKDIYMFMCSGSGLVRLQKGKFCGGCCSGGWGDQSVHLATTSYAGTRAIMEVD